MDNCASSARKLAILANAIAVALTDNLTPSQQNVLGNLVVQVGSTILSIAAATELCKEAQSNNTSSSQKPSDTSQNC